MPNRKYPGYFLVIDGIDGSGKSTLCKKVYEHLDKHEAHVPVHLTSEPSEGTVGRMIRTILRGGRSKPSEVAMAHLFVADRIMHYEDEILPKLEAGWVVISDRYSASTVCYQGRGSMFSYTLNLHDLVPKPDEMILLLPSVEIALKRVADRQESLEVYEREATLRRVSDNYGSLVQPNCPLCDKLCGVYPPDDWSMEDLDAAASGIAESVVRSWLS